MNCFDCGEPIKQSEEASRVTCKCGAELHFECRMTDTSTAKDYCEPCYYEPSRLAFKKKKIVVDETTGALHGVRDEDAKS